MSFLRPWFLVLLAGVVAFAAAYLVLQRRRRHYAVRFTNIDLLDSIAPKRPGWRRHVPAVGVMAALVAAIVGLAGPVHDVEVEQDAAVVMLAIDVSASMNATDVAPDRLRAAIDAAGQFIDDLPDTFQVGLVAFDGSARLVAAPTTDHASVVDAVEGLRTGPGTAAGDGIIAALDAIEVAQSAAQNVSLKARGDAAPADAPSATIVLLSDGATTVGRPVEDAAAAASAAGVPVSTITFGTDQGTVVVEGEVVSVPPDGETMAAVAEETGGQAFDASSTAELESVYDDIEGTVGTDTAQSPLVMWFLGAAVLLVALAATGSMIWTGRFL